MIIGVCRETFPGERRVALIPAGVPSLTKAGLEVTVESNAGLEAGYLDSEYASKGARIVSDRDELFQADVILQVRALGANREAGRADLDRMRAGHILIGACDPLGNAEAIREAAERGITVFAMELIPRITRAQSMDVLSSMATIAGYKAVLLAANRLPKMFPMLMTAAGTITPARVLVVGAGVAGLQAIASARRLGAIVQAYDVRPAVKEQVESLGAKFVEMDLETSDAEGTGGYAKAMDDTFYQRQCELMARVVAENDVCITTAAIPGRPSPTLITAEAVRGMRPGSVIVDLAAERGGNCELTEPDAATVQHGVTLLGPTNLPSEVPFHASQMVSKNVSTFVLHLVHDKAVTIDTQDEITRGTLAAHAGRVTHPSLREVLGIGGSENELPGIENTDDSEREYELMTNDEIPNDERMTKSE